jgi:hypothetical protein
MIFSTLSENDNFEIGTIEGYHHIIDSKKIVVPCTSVM